MRILAFDTETYLIQDTEKAPKVVCCQWADGSKVWMTRPDDATTLALWSDLSAVYVGVNIAYDLVACMRWVPHLIPHIMRALDEGRVFDCTTRECLEYLGRVGRLGYKARPSLAELAAKYLGLDLSAQKKGDDIWRLKYGTLDGVPFSQWPKEAVEYALGDATHTWMIFQAQGSIGAIQPTEQDQVRSSVVLHAIGVYGFGINQTVRKQIQAALLAQRETLWATVGPLGWSGKGSQAAMGAALQKAWHLKHRQQIDEYLTHTGTKLDWSVWASVPEEVDLRAWAKDAAAKGMILPGVLIYDGIDPARWMEGLVDFLTEIPRTTRGIQTSEEAIEGLAGILPEVTAYIDFKHVEKMIGTYIDPYKDDTIHPSFINLHTTGRTGCRAPNSQNVPRKNKDRPYEAFRTMFCARPGRTLGTVDYSQLELCTLAATIRHNMPTVKCVLGEAIDNNLDVHCITGGQIAGLTYEQMIAGKKAKDEKILEYRQSSKAANFGYPGGLGPNTFISYAKNNYGVTLNFEQANNMRQSWRQTWPDAVAYLRAAGRVLEGSPRGCATGYTITGRAKAGLSYTEYCNYAFQGLAADGAKRALWAQWREMVLGHYWHHHPDQARRGYGYDLRQSPLRDSAMVNFVHDEIVDEHPTGEAGKEALKRQEDLMVREMYETCKRLITIRVEGKLSDQWEH